MRPDAERPWGRGRPRAWLPGVRSRMDRRGIEANGSALEARRVGVASGRRLSRAMVGGCRFIRGAGSYYEDIDRGLFESGIAPFIVCG